MSGRAIIALVVVVGVTSFAAALLLGAWIIVCDVERIARYLRGERRG